MKKILIPIICALVIGTTFGFILFRNTKNEINTVFAEENKISIFQIGVFGIEENAINIQKEYEGSIIVHDDYYRVYYGVFKNKSCIKKMQDYLEENKINYYLKESTIKNDQFLDQLSQYEEIIINTTDTEVFLKTNAKMLKLYESEELNKNAD